MEFLCIIIDHLLWGLHIRVYNIVAGKDFEADKEAYSTEEWKDRVEKWKVKQEKRGLVNKDDTGNNDQAEEDDYLYAIHFRFFCHIHFIIRERKH